MKDDDGINTRDNVADNSYGSCVTTVHLDMLYVPQFVCRVHFVS